jgi:hypothetical protein
LTGQPLLGWLAAIPVTAAASNPYSSTLISTRCWGAAICKRLPGEAWHAAIMKPQRIERGFEVEPFHPFALD